MNDPSPHQLRRAWFSGYRVADVEVLLAQFSLRLSHVWNELQTTKNRLEDSERERRDAEQRLIEAHRREAELAATLTARSSLVERAEQEADRRAQEITDEAQLEAARIRAEALVETEGARGQVDQLLRLRDTLSATVRAASRDLERVLTPGVAPTATLPSPAPAVPVDAPREQAPPPLPALRDVPVSSDLFDRHVQVEAGPFADFASLSAFERELGRLPKVEDVYIRRFEGDRATIELTLAEPGPLLAAMAEQMPYSLSVDHAAGDRIALNVAAS